MIKRGTVNSGMILCLVTLYFLPNLLCLPVEADTLSSANDQSQSYAAGAHSDDQDRTFEALTTAVLHKELELERLNTNFRIKTTLVSPWRQRRVFCYGESNASLTEGALLNTLPLRYRLAREKIKRPPPNRKNRRTFTNSLRTQLVGQCIGSGGDILELGLNLINYYKLHRNGFSPAMYQKRLQSLHTELDGLIAQRQTILKAHIWANPFEEQVAQSEEKLLDDVRDLSLLEYSRYLSATKRFWVFQNTAFFVDLAKNSTSGAASIIGLAANHLRRLRMVGGAGLLNTISGVIVLITPAVGRVTGNLSGLAAERTVSGELTNIQATRAETFIEDRQKFLSLLETNQGKTTYLRGARARSELYTRQDEIIVGTREFLNKQRERARGTLQENLIFAGIVAPPRISNGILTMIGTWHYYANSPTRNKLGAAGNTAYLGGNTFNMFETARVQASLEWHNHKEAKTNLSPYQHFHNRLQIIDALDKRLSQLTIDKAQ
jgi:hypothetical protein